MKGFKRRMVARAVRRRNIQYELSSQGDSMALFHNFAIRMALRSAAARNGHPPEVLKLLHNKSAFDAFVNDKLKPKMSETDDGKAFFGAQGATALPQGWFMNLLNYIMANFPTILADILAVLNLFPHAPMEAFRFDPFAVLGILGKILPNIGDIYKDATAGMSLTDLVSKYGETELKLFQEIIVQFAA